VCEGCGKPLSRYNSARHCQACASSGRDEGSSPEDSGGQLTVRGLAGLRRKRGLTQELLADRAGVSLGLVQKLEQGARRSARLSTLTALARVLNVPVSVLLGSGQGVMAESADTVTAAQAQGPPDYLPAEVLGRPDFASACTGHDLGAMFTIAVRRGGAGFTASHIARRCEMSIGRVGDYMKGRMRAQSVAIFERVSDGLHIPGVMLGMGSRPWESDDYRWLSPDEFCVEVRRLLAERGMSLRELARRSHYHASHVSNVLNGRKRVTAHMAEDIDKTLGAGGKLAALVPAMAETDCERPGRVGHSVTGDQLQTATEDERISAEKEAEEEMERRNLLRGLAALGIAASPIAEALETVREGFGKVFDYDDRNHVDDWEEAVAEYGYAYHATSPIKLIPDLAADLVAVRSIAYRLTKDDAEYRGWCRVGGALSVLVAKTLYNLDYPRESRQWWRIAQHVADASGDLELSLWARGEHIFQRIYQHHPAQIILRQIEEGKSHACDHICGGLADMSASRAQVLALVGGGKAAEDELRQAERILGQLPSTALNASVMGWGEDRLRYTETWVYSHLGNEIKADAAALRAISLYSAADSRSPTQVKLMQAFARIRSGDISEGIRQAQLVYGELSVDQRTAILDSLARKVLNHVPAQVHSRPDVVAYRELLASSPPLKAIES